MFIESDREFLDSPEYNMALEKYFHGGYYQKYNASNNHTLDNAYLFSNEQMKDIFKHINVKNKSVLTVGSSGDQAINALYYGASDVTIIDANLYTKYMTQYKIAAIKNLSFEEFRQYFVTLERPFAKEVYQKLFHDLDPDCQAFWGTIFLNESDDDFNFEIYHNLAERCDCFCDEIASSFYTNPICYKRLQEQLRKSLPEITFLTAEFSDFPTIAKRKYDLILLSNVFRYTEDRFRDVTESLYQNNLNEGGKIQLHYNFKSSEYDYLPYIFKGKKITTLELPKKDKTYFLTKPKTTEKDRTL